MTFTERDRGDPFWKRLEQHLRDRLHILREQNDAPKSDAETAALRGRIAELKETLALADKPAPKIEPVRFE